MNISHSPFISIFNQKGYRTKQITDPLSNYRNVGLYLANFSEPAFESNDHWNLIPEIVKEINKPDKSFVFSFYYGTHYPYTHGLQYNKFKPEVDNTFNYSQANLIPYREEIKNKYRNCLSEADKWLENLFSQIDLDNTMIVISGDHGEEFFENGRLSHAATLEEPQIRTPLILHLPNKISRKINRVTSHLDIMSTIIDLMGWKIPSDTIGHSLLSVNDEKDVFAIVTRNKGKRLPTQWAVVSENLKIIYKYTTSNELSIIDVLDSTDNTFIWGEDLEIFHPNIKHALLLESRIKQNRK